MTSPHWDEARAAAYREFRFEFPEKTLARRTVIVAGGTGGLGSATVALLAREGVNLVVGYRRDRERARRLVPPSSKEFGRKLTLVEGDLSEAKRTAEAISKRPPSSGSSSGRRCNFPGRSGASRVLKTSIAIAGGISRIQLRGPGIASQGRGRGDGGQEDRRQPSLLATMQAITVFPSSLSYAAPKAALVHAVRILAQQWNRVRVNVIAPGATIAGMAAASVQSGKYDRYIR